MDPFFEAVLNDDDGLWQLLRESPARAHERMTRDYLVENVHWLYVGDTPLHLAAAALRVRAVQILLESGADPNALNRRGATPLHYASDPRPGRARSNHAAQARVIQLLVQYKAAVQQADQGGATPLHRAVRSRSPVAVRELLAARAPIDARMRTRGSTPLHLAVQSTGAGGTAGAEDEQLEIIRLLLDRGADPAAQDVRGRSVFDWSTNERTRAALSAPRSS